jgi:hypothetical protein
MVNVAADEAAGAPETVHLAAVPGGTAVPRGAAVPWFAAGAAADCDPHAAITPAAPMIAAAARIDARRIRTSQSRYLTADAARPATNICSACHLDARGMASVPRDHSGAGGLIANAGGLMAGQSGGKCHA